jgi:glycosyltransferase involved in cell wall biosynthesis
MTQPPAVSVIIPTYNREHLLPISVTSVRKQTYGDWELLIVDDHSTDGTRHLVESWQEDDPRIRYFTNERTKGPAGARNTGIDHARGRYVAFLDSDDEWEQHHLQTMVDYLAKYQDDLDLISANSVRKIRSTGEVYHRCELDLTQYHYRRLEDLYCFAPDTLFETAMRRSIITTQTMVMKREVLTRVRFDESLPPGPEDALFHLELAHEKIKVGHLQRCHVVYWAHGSNLTSAGGQGNLASKLPLLFAFETAAMKTLERFSLTAAQRARVLDWLADLYFWYIGYNGYQQTKDFWKARRYYCKAIRLRPLRITYWKTFLLSFLKQLTNSHSNS